MIIINLIVCIRCAMVKYHLNSDERKKDPATATVAFATGIYHFKIALMAVHCCWPNCAQIYQMSTSDEDFTPLANHFDKFNEIMMMQVRLMMLLEKI